ncbi:MAG: DUF3617 family protein [Betaproteobacteria bacterium]
MSRPYSIAIIAGLLTLSPFAIAAPMQPGLWEMAMTVTIEGRVETVPAGSACVMQKDIDDPIKTLPRPAGECTLTNVQRTADRATYDLVCKDNVITSQGHADIALSGDRYVGKVTLTLQGKQGTGTPFELGINAKRLGDCTR